MNEGTVLCEVLYVVLSPMDGYDAPGSPWRVHRVIQERYLGMCPRVYQVTYILKVVCCKNLQPEAGHYWSYLERSVKKKHLHCVSSVTQSVTQS